jgi:hypothetical protein
MNPHQRYAGVRSSGRVATVLGRMKGASMIELTEQQRSELEKQQPVEVRDPKTNEIYVLLRKDLYERVRSLIREVNERADWDDAAFDVYGQDVS